MKGEVLYCQDSLCENVNISSFHSTAPETFGIAIFFKLSSVSCVYVCPWGFYHSKEESLWSHAIPIFCTCHMTYNLKLFEVCEVVPSGGENGVTIFSTSAVAVSRLYWIYDVVDVFSSKMWWGTSPGITTIFYYLSCTVIMHISFCYHVVNISFSNFLPVLCIFFHKTATVSWSFTGEEVMSSYLESCNPQNKHECVLVQKLQTFFFLSQPPGIWYSKTHSSCFSFCSIWHLLNLHKFQLGSSSAASLSLGPFVFHHLSRLKSCLLWVMWVGGCLHWVWWVRDPTATCGRWEGKKSIYNLARNYMNTDGEIWNFHADKNCFNFLP